MKQISHSHLPHFWSGMSFVAKAAWLVTARQADAFNEAASMLAHPHKRITPNHTNETHSIPLAP